MAYIPTVDDVGAGTRRVLGNTENVFVAKGINVISTDQSAFTGTGIHSINIQGTVAGAASAFVIGASGSASSGHSVLIGSEGYVGSTNGLYSVIVQGYDSIIENRGEIWGAFNGIWMAGTTPNELMSELVNSGTIRGKWGAVARSGGEDFLFTNLGSTIGRRETTAFLSVDDGDDTVLNGGRMVGSVMLGDGEDMYDGRIGALIHASNGGIFGEGGNDMILAGTGDDRLIGGTGNDLLSGGAGADIFIFRDELNKRTNVDRISDFSVLDDQIHIGNVAFGGLAVGTLGRNQFTANASGQATDALDRIIYETDTGNLFFDADGNGAGKAVLFAKIGKSLEITHRDFEVFNQIPDFAPAESMF